MNDNRNSKLGDAQPPVHTGVANQASPRSDRKRAAEPAALLSPAALLALGLVGAATAAQRVADPAAATPAAGEGLGTNSGAQPLVAADPVVAADTVPADTAAPDAVAADTAAEGANQAAAPEAADAAGAGEAAAAAAPDAAEAVLVAQADVAPAIEAQLAADGAADAVVAGGLEGPVMVAQAAVGAAAAEAGGAAAAGGGAAAGSGAAAAGAGAAGAGAAAGAAATVAGISATTIGLVAGAVGVAAVASDSGSDAAPDTAPPAAPSLVLVSDTGSSATDGVTRNGQVNVSGLEEGATWQFSTNGGSSWTTGTGTSFTLEAGSYAAGAVQVRQTDGAGNNSTAASLTSAITVDLTGPAAATLALASDTGSGASDGITKDGSVAVSGLEEGATWEFSTDGGTTWAAGTGTSIALAAGTYAAGTVQVRQTDAAGNLGTAASLGAVTVDTSAAAPTLALASDTGSSGTDGITRTGTVQVSNLEAGATWEFSSNGGTTWAAGSGSSFTLAAGTYAAGAVQVRQTDAAGNLSAAGSGTALTVDATAPAAPAAALAADTGGSTSDGVTRNGAVNVTGLETGAGWQFSTNGGTTWATGTGTGFTLPAGSYAADTVQVRQIDVAGNTGAAGKIAAALRVDTTAAAPTVALSNDSGSSSSDGVTNVGTVTVSGLETSATWQFSTNGGTSFTTGTGTSFTLAAGTYAANAVQVRQTDVAGNTSAVGGNATALVVDASAAAPSLTLAADTGSNTSDGITRTGTVNVTGLEAGATWTFSTNGGTSFAAGTGSSFTLPAGSYAAGAVRVVQTDAAGNISTAGSNAASLTVDATAPAALTAALANDSGSSGSDGITSQGVVNVSGLETGATWEFSTDSGASFSAGTGTSFTLATGSYAANAVQVRQTDVAGNTGTAGRIGTAITVDVAAAAPGLALASDTGSSNSDGITSTGTVNVSGLEEGATWQFSTNGGTSFAPGTGASFTLAAGNYAAGAVQVRQTDAAGNTSSVGSNAGALNVDTTAPAAPGVALGADTGSSNSDGITRDGTVSVSGLEPGASWQFSTDSGATFGAGNGSSFTLASGVYTAGQVQVRQTDAAGNQGAATSVATGVTVDSVAPTVAIQAPAAGPDNTGKLVFDIVFGEAVAGFDASDVAVGNGTQGAFTAVSATQYQVEVTPASSTTPVNLTLDVAAAAAADIAGNDSAAAAQYLASVLFGTAGNDSLTVGAAKDFVFLGAGGNDVLAIGAAANSSLAATDEVSGLSAGDRIDLSAMLGAGAGYNQVLSGDVGAGFIELQNFTLTQNTNNTTTAVRFNVNFDAAEIGGTKIAGAVVDLVYDYSVARALSINNPTFTDPNSGEPVNVWATSAGNASNGKIALAADQDPDLLAANPIIDGTGRAFGVTLTLNGLFDSFKVGLEAKPGGVTEISAGGTQDVAVGVDKLAGSQAGALFVFQDTGTLGTVGDNQLRFVTTYDAQDNVTHLQLQFDTNSAFGTGQTTAGAVVAMDFEGNVQNLIPAALQYVGP